jgi:hypothetical protein
MEPITHEMFCANCEESYSAFAITSERSEASIGFASNRPLYL